MKFEIALAAIALALLFSAPARAAMPLCPDGQRSYFGICPDGQAPHFAPAAQPAATTAMAVSATVNARTAAHERMVGRIMWKPPLSSRRRCGREGS